MSSTSSLKDTTPKTFAEMRPPGYWSSALGYFVEVRMISEEEGARLRAEREEDWFGKPPADRAGGV